MTRWLIIAWCVGLVALVAAAGCGDDGVAVVDTGINGGDASLGVDASNDATPPCVRSPGPADATRKVVFAHPYDDAGMQAGNYEVYDLTSAGVLSSTGVTFAMSRAFDGTIAFTPDGRLGFSVQDNGSLGIFRINDNGSVDVLHAAYDANGADDFYATGIVMNATGDKAYVLNGQWRNNGGGIYGITINCDDTIDYGGLLAPAKLAYGMHLVPGADQVVVIADDVLNLAEDATNSGAHLLDWSGVPSVVTSADIFDAEDAIVSSTALTADGRFVLVGDNNDFSMADHRIAIAELSGNTLTGRGILSPIEDPVAIIASPDNDAVVVVSGVGDAFVELDYDPSNTTTPFSVVGELSYVGTRPQLPGGAVLITRGLLRGRVVVAELTGIRQLQFGGGSISDLGETSVGSGYTAITGAIGVQP